MNKSHKKDLFKELGEATYIIYQKKSYELIPLFSLHRILKKKRDHQG